MKILTFADTHGPISEINKLVKKSKEADLVICAGDISFFSDNLEKRIQALSKSKVPVLITHGNHESRMELKKICKPYKNITFLHQASKRINDILFLFYGGGGFSVKDRTFEQLGKDFEKKIKATDKVVLVTHAPPYNTKLDVVHKHHVGNESIEKFIKRVQPMVAISGHIHESEYIVYKFRKTLLVNPGPKGRILEI